MFITFEGIEGSGKTTQIKLLLEWLEKENISFVNTLEPGGTEIGRALRQLLLDCQSSLRANLSELFLFAADRCEHLVQVIQPALERGDWVICDRYIDSTFAYQHGGRGHAKQDVLDMIRFTKAIQPDITFLLDLDPTEGLQRAQRRAELDRFETEALSFHQKVRSAYLESADMYPDRVVTIDVGNQSIEAIFSVIVTEINARRLSNVKNKAN